MASEEQANVGVTGDNDSNSKVSSHSTGGAGSGNVCIYFSVSEGDATSGKDGDGGDFMLCECDG